MVTSKSLFEFDHQAWDPPTVLGRGWIPLPPPRGRWTVQMGGCTCNFPLLGDRGPGLGLVGRAAPSLMVARPGPRTPEDGYVSEYHIEVFRSVQARGCECPLGPLSFPSFPRVPTFEYVLNPSTSHGLPSDLPGAAPGSGSWAPATASPRRPVPSVPPVSAPARAGPILSGERSGHLAPCL